jgi:hypothetical protein
MKYLKKFESPDNIKMSNVKLGCYDDDAIPFGYFKNRLYIGLRKSVHFGMLKRYNSKMIKDIKEYHLSGRLWANFKIIAFWTFPTKSELYQFVDDWNSANHIKKENHNIFIDTNWSVEVPSKNLKSSTLVSIKDYINPNMSWDEIRELLFVA